MVRRRADPCSFWNSEKLRRAVEVDGAVDGKPGDRGWTCEIALPMEDVVPAPNIPPKPADRWRLNLYRVEKPPRPTSPGLRPCGPTSTCPPGSARSCSRPARSR